MVILKEVYVVVEEKDLVKKLEELLDTMRPWEKKPVLKAGKVVVELVKLPERKTKTTLEPEKLVLHIRLEDAFRGIFLENQEELDDLETAITMEKVRKIIEAIEKVSKKRKVIEYSL